MKPKEFHAQRSVQRAYEDAISSIAKRVLMPKKKEQTVQEWLAELAARAEEEDVRRAADVLAGRMITQVNVKNARTWREAARRSHQPRKLYALMKKELEGQVGFRLRQLRRENAELISSVAPEAARMLAREITTLQGQGARASTVAKMARTRFPKLLRSRINLVSRTESQKASAALTQARAEHAGVAAYEWVTSEDARVRASHRAMNGVIVLYSDPPDPDALLPAGKHPSKLPGPYHAGNIYNCRCSQAPVLDVDDVKFPAKVYWRGRVRDMNKPEFLRLAGGRIQK